MKRIVLVCVIALLAFACKNEAKETTQKETTAVVKEVKSNPELKVTMSFKSNKADEFKLALNNIVVAENQYQQFELEHLTNKLEQFFS
mgnify:CR=1 FL=1